jgi:hypothetical protein
MLSPNAMNLVPISRGGSRTKTDVVQLAETLRASVAVHVTRVVPPANRLPDTGVQASVTGAVPPVVVGEPNVTDTGSPSVDCPSTAGGQVIVICGTGPGPLGLDPHPAIISNHAATRTTRVLKCVINATHPRATR